MRGTRDSVECAASSVHCLDMRIAKRPDADQPPIPAWARNAVHQAAMELISYALGVPLITSCIEDSG